MLLFEWWNVVSWASFTSLLLLAVIRRPVSAGGCRGGAGPLPKFGCPFAICSGVIHLPIMRFCYFADLNYGIFWKAETLRKCSIQVCALKQEESRSKRCSDIGILYQQYREIKLIPFL